MRLSSFSISCVLMLFFATKVATTLNTFFDLYQKALINDYFRLLSYLMLILNLNVDGKTNVNNLEKAIDNLEEKKNESLSNDANDFFFLSKDVARILLANICMYQGEYSQAEKLLGKVISNGFYGLDASNYNNKETITNLFNNGSSKKTIFATHNELQSRGNISIGIPLLVPIMTYTDVVLSYAESLYKNGRTLEAESQLQKVITAKHISATGENTLEKIKDARLQLMLYTNTNFAFMKRNNFAKEVYGIEEYRLLLPIPQQEIDVNSSMTQNPGY